MLPSRPLKVLLFTRADAERNAGGDLVEAQRLCAGLSAAGHEATVGTADADYGADWDVVHLFNIDRAAELATFLERHDRFPGARVVLAPVFSTSHKPRSEPLARLLRPVANLAFSSARPRVFWVPGLATQALQRRVDALHFHTAAEARDFKNAYPGFDGPSAVIPPPVARPEPETDHTLELPVHGPFLASVARVEPLKNQLWLLTSGISRVLPIVFAGPLNPKRTLFGKRFKGLIRRTPGCHWLGPLEQSGVRQLLENATAHILPSRRENFGLATLEALDAGCEAIVPKHHFIIDELEDAVHAFDLHHVESLHAAVSRIVEGARRAPYFSRERYSTRAVTEAVVRLYGASGREHEI